MIKVISILIYLRAFLAFAIIGPILLLIIFIYPRSLYSLVIPFCKLMIFMFGCKIKVRGQLPKNEFFVIMANHVSFLDVFAIPTVLSSKFSAVAASINFKIPLYSLFLRKLRVVPINRSNKEKAIASINQAQEVLKDGYHIVVLPEGTRTISGSLGKLKKGGFHLAKNTNSRILPIITKGLFEIKPKNRWYIKPGKIEIYICDPINTKNKEIDILLDEAKKVFLNS